MYDGYQVLRFENNYKSKDLYLISFGVIGSPAAIST